MQGICGYVEECWRRHLAKNNFTQRTPAFILLERPEDAHASRWEPDFDGTDCWRTGCCVAVCIPVRGKAFVTLGHASSVYSGGKRELLVSPTPFAQLSKTTAEEYADFFLRRANANCSVRYISLWQRDRRRNGTPLATPPLHGLRIFGTKFAAVTEAQTVTDAVGYEEETQMRQFGRAELVLSVDLHAIAVPFERK